MLQVAAQKGQLLPLYGKSPTLNSITDVPIHVKFGLIAMAHATTVKQLIFTLNMKFIYSICRETISTKYFKR